MIKTGFESTALNESLDRELATAVKNLTPSLRRQMVAGLGDVDIQNTDIPITKLSGPRDSRIKSRDYYFFFIYKSSFGKTPYQLMVTDELKQRVIIDTMLNSVVNAAGDTIEVNSMSGSLSWTKRIKYAYAIYAIKASDAASRAGKRAARAAAKQGSDLDPNSPFYRKTNPSTEAELRSYDKSGYRSVSPSRQMKKDTQATVSKPDVSKKAETVRERILSGLLKGARTRLDKLTEAGAPAIMIEGQRKIIARLEAGEMKISGDKDALDDIFQSIEPRKGRGGKTYYVINGNINYFPAAQYGPYIKRA